MQKIKAAWQLVCRSLKSELHDFTTLPIRESVILLAIPMMLELSLESVFAVVDMFFVSKLGQNAIATVGLTESVVTIVYCVAIGLSTGATAIVARRIGEKNHQGAAHAGAQAILVAVLVSILLGVCGWTFAEDILRFMGAAPEVIREGVMFTKITLGGALPIVMLFLINGIFRGAGDATMAMRSLWLASAANIILCPIMIHFYGLTGAALATLFGRSIGVAYQCYHLVRGDGEMKMALKHFVLDLPIVKSIASVAWPASFQFIIGSGSWIILTRMVAETGGTPASAAYQIAVRCFVFFILPSMGLANAAATLVGQNLGARNFARAEESAIVTAKLSGTLMFFVTLFLWFGAPDLIRIFTQDEAVARMGVEALRGIGIGFVFYGVGGVMTMALNGAGATRLPTLINIFCFWIIQIPLSYYLVYHTAIGYHGAIYSIPVGHIVLTVIAWYVFKLGRWKDIKL